MEKNEKQEYKAKTEVHLQTPAKWSTPKWIKTTKVKVGRNEFCPCGSGKKYKKCCGKPV